MLWSVMVDACSLAMFHVNYNSRDGELKWFDKVSISLIDFLLKYLLITNTKLQN